MNSKARGIVVIKKGRERSLQNRHPWIFSGAVQSISDSPDGSVCEVHSSTGEFLALGYFNKRSSLTGRIISFAKGSPEEIVKSLVRRSIEVRKGFFNESVTNAYRLINGEGDGLPGLIVDKYRDVLVLQCGTLGIELLKPTIVEELKKILSPKAIFEKSKLPSRKEEGLEDREELLFGEEIPDVEILENGNKFVVAFHDSQKTGFFLDQREMRSLVGTLSKGRGVLNCFSYTGGFSVYAAKGGATRTVSVDISDGATALAKNNLALNGFEGKSHECYAADVFDYLRQSAKGFDLIILDPPAFAKKKDHVSQAAKGYNEINRVALQNLAPGGILVTCSCSHFMEEELFQKILFSAARDAGKNVRIIHRHRQAFDHPISVYHPEGEYLKSLVLLVE